MAEDVSAMVCSMCSDQCFSPERCPDGKGGDSMESRRLALDVSVEESRALHRVVRAMHDGHCPKCGHLGPASEFLIDLGLQSERHECAQCKFTVFAFEAVAALQAFQPHLKKSVDVFEHWRARFGEIREQPAAASTAVQLLEAKWREMQPGRYQTLTEDREDEAWMNGFHAAIDELKKSQLEE